MKSKYIIFSLMISLSIGFLTSCNNDDDGNARASSSANDFVWRGLNFWYFWKDDVPNLADDRFSSNSEYNSFINTNANTESFFYSLLNQYGTIDRFSWIQDYDSLIDNLSGVSYNYGMDYSLYHQSNSNNKVLGYIQYVVPGSPAANAGLERGDIFYTVNGTVLTVDNYSNLLNQSSYNLGLVDVTSVSDNTLAISDITETISLAATELEENPVYYSDVIVQGPHKIGYLVYNSFRANYNDELNNAIGNLAGQGITDLVLDLRYNSGGSLDTSVALAGMVTGQFNNEPFVKLKFNQDRSDNNKTYRFSNSVKTYEYNGSNLIELESISLNTLGLDKLYVLTSYGTASASELLIHSLEPYIDVIKIGSNTRGKFEGSITLVDSPPYFLDPEERSGLHNWAMQPIVFAYFNSEDERGSSDGLSADYAYTERDYLNNIQPLGNAAEPFLQKAISLITGTGRGVVETRVLNPIDLSISTTKEIHQKGSGLYLDQLFSPNL